MNQSSKKLAKRETAKKTPPHKDAFVAEIALVIALPEERNYFHEVVSSREKWTVTSQRQHYHCFYDTELGQARITVKTLDGMGQLEAILGSSSLISSISPDLSIMLGIAGSMNPEKVGLGDVVVANQAKYFGSDKVASSGKPYVFGNQDALTKTLENGSIVVDERDRFLGSSFLRYERNFVESSSVDHLLSEVEGQLKSSHLIGLDGISIPKDISELQSTQRDRLVHMGWLLGSHHVVDSKEYREYLKEKNLNLQLDVHRQKGDAERVRWKDGELLAVDMESYGMLKTVELSRNTPPMYGGCRNLIGGIAVRGISDLCEKKGNLDRSTKDGVRKIAVRNATVVCLSLIENLDFDAIVFNRG